MNKGSLILINTAKDPVSCSNRHQKYIFSREHVAYYSDL
jgi:hypothetical protein